MDFKFNVVKPNTLFRVFLLDLLSLLLTLYTLKDQCKCLTHFDNQRELLSKGCLGVMVHTWDPSTHKACVPST